MWQRTELSALLGTRLPLIQAPMAGFTTPELAAAVCQAGALGSLACATLSPAAIRDQVAALRQRSDAPFNLNFFSHGAAAADAPAARAMRSALAPFFAEYGLGAVPEPSDPLPHFDAERLRLAVELRPKVVSFHFGLPSSAAVGTLKRAGCVVLCSATTVAEARRLAAEGADAIIAQGYEAGGHRGSFTDGPGAGLVGTLALVPQVVDAVPVPVIAAGGIADGRGIAAAMALGASGVQIGTAFLGCPEANLSPFHRSALRAASDESTHITRAFTGRPARAIRNRLSSAIDDAAALAFPLQASLVAPLLAVARDDARAAFLPVWAGQAAALMRELPAGALISKWLEEARAAMGAAP